jgi:hypothetical protein
LGKLKDLKYTIGYSKSGAVPRKSSGDNPWAALSETLLWVQDFFIKDLEKQKIEKKLDSMYPDIFKAMGDYNGVLVIIRFHKWRIPYPSGHNPHKVLSIFIGPAASNQQSAVRKYRMKESIPMIKQAPDDKMIYGPEAFLWFSKGSSTSDKEEPLKRLGENKEKQHWKSAR